MILATLALAAVLQSGSITRPATFLWDYPTVDMNAGNVNRFELRMDGGAWTDVGRTAAPDQTGAPAGSVIYTTNVTALTIGQHVVEVRSCNALECGPESSLKFVIAIRPAAVQNFRIGGG